MPLTSGTHLGFYEIVSPLGAGGMGEVYRARDPRLGRDVAIKILPDAFVDDPERIARFQREAQLLAALNHPNIAGIHGLEDAGPTRFIVMELVEGESLDARLKASRSTSQLERDGFSRASPLPLDEALAIARQIASALEAAHEKGIVHRDLKPGNIMLTADDRVKVLDFGLAKHDAVGSSGSGSLGLTHSPTLTFAATQAGVILGTAAYMSPEQARGRPSDKRTDVWSFGCVLYEMLAGKRAFDGDDATDIIAAVVRGEPDWSVLNEAVPPAIRSIVKRCLEKDRTARIPDMSVVRFLMADAEAAPKVIGAPLQPGGGQRTAAVAGVALIAGALAAALASWALLRPRAAAHPFPARFTVNMPAAQVLAVAGPDRSVVISPDGTRIAYVSGSDLDSGGQLFVRRLDQLEAMPVRGVTSARSPFFSPDSRWIGYFDAGVLKKVSVTGGPPISISRVDGGTRGSSWGADDTIVFATNDASTGLASVPAGGGEPRVLTKPDSAHGELDHFFPAILPGGRAVVFTVMMAGGTTDTAQIAALDLKTGQRRTLIRGGSHAEYVDGIEAAAPRTGYMIYASSGTLRGVRFNPERLEVLSDPFLVVDQIRTEATGAAHFSASRNGAFVYATGGSGTFDARSLVWVDRHGQEQPIDLPSRAYTYPRMSPDSARVAVSIADQEQDIWILDRGRQLTRLTFGPSVESHPVWTPDGRRLFFSSNRAGPPNVFWQAADNTGTMQEVTRGGQGLVVPFTISPDGKMLLVSMGGAQDIGLVRLDGGREVVPLITGPGIQGNPEISPDGRWLAYQSDESGRSEIYVRPFPNVEAGRSQVSIDGGAKPVWARNGQELFYLAPDLALTAVAIRTTPSFSSGQPTTLFKARYYIAPAGRTYDVAPDGQKFLMIKYAPGVDRETASPPLMVVVVNWFEELRARAEAAAK